MKPKLVFAHGWGFHAGVWAQIAPHFYDYEVSFWGPAYIRGGPAVVRDIPDGAIVVAYSFGVAQALKAAAPKLSGLFSICGFDSLAARGREEAVRDMMAGLSRNPHAQMRAFWATCGVNRFALPDECNVTQLEQGLCDMLQVDARAELDALACPSAAIASRDDRVIPLTVSSAVWGRSGLIVSEHGGHGLPMTRAPWCVEQIKRFLETHVA